MIAPIPGIPSVLTSDPSLAAARAGMASIRGGQIPAGAPASSFAGELAAAVAHVEASAKASDVLRERLLRGEDVELHTAAIQAQDAQISFELLLQVRNKLIQGYQEIMRMQI